LHALICGDASPEVLWLERSQELAMSPSQPLLQELSARLPELASGLVLIVLIRAVGPCIRDWLWLRAAVRVLQVFRGLEGARQRAVWMDTPTARQRDWRITGDQFDKSG
jgi:hypothetical protein